MVTRGEETLPVEVVEEGGRYRVRVDQEWVEVDARLLPGGAWSLLMGGASYVADVSEESAELVVTVGGERHRLRVEEAGRRFGRRLAGRASAGGERLVAPMPGRVVAVHVRSGDRVDIGTPLLVLEAMKMENEFHAMTPGTVAEVAVSAGQPVNAGDLLLVLRPEGA